MNICKAKSSLAPLRYLANSFLSSRPSATRCFSSQEQKNSVTKTKDLFSEEQLARLRVGKDGQVFPTYTSKVGLPRTRKLYTVIRSPFVHKKSREQFEMRIHKQLLIIKAKPHELQKKFFWLKRQVFVGAQHEVTVKYQTRLPLSDLNKILNKKPEVVSRATTK